MTPRWKPTVSRAAADAQAETRQQTSGSVHGRNQLSNKTSGATGKSPLITLRDQKIKPLPTPSGPVDLKIPAGSQQGRKLRLKGRGLPAKSPGDLYVVLEVSLPPAESSEAKKIYQQMHKEMDFNPRMGLGV